MLAAFGSALAVADLVTASQTKKSASSQTSDVTFQLPDDPTSTGVPISPPPQTFGNGPTSIPGIQIVDPVTDPAASIPGIQIVDNIGEPPASTPGIQIVDPFGEPAVSTPGIQITEPFSLPPSTFTQSGGQGGSASTSNGTQSVSSTAVLSSFVAQTYASQIRFQPADLLLTL